MSFGFPAYSTGSQSFNLAQHDLIDIVRKSLEAVGWRYEMPAPNEFVARNSVNLWSWGEKIFVAVSDDGTVTAKSQCMLATQCFDWGKNNENVKTLFNVISRTTAAYGSQQFASPSDRTPVERVIKEDSSR